MNGEDKVGERRADQVLADAQMQRDMGYLLAKLDGLDQFIRLHMDQEEEKFSHIDKHIRRLSMAVLVIALITILEAFGIPAGSLALKLLGIVL